MDGVVREGDSELRALRAALGLYATGVAIVTTRALGGPHIGVTVNSFVSVSLNPPLVLFCLSSRSSLLTAFENAGHFTVNVLAKDQQALSNRFAKPSLNNWDGVPFRAGQNGCAVLGDAAAALECVRRAAYPGGDHIIIVGEVMRFETISTAEPLVFYQGSYGTFTRDQSGMMAPPDGSLSDFVYYWG
jgi:flavin reductase (DIM6/NTAB) family NADH-FMN oxidoreductase RutF